MERWQKALSASIISPEGLSARYGIDPQPLKAVAERYPMRITPHYLGLIREYGDPIWRQCVPDPAELADDHLSSDPLHEERHSPVPGVIHRYPDRLVLMVSLTCATLCRFCMRKRRVASGGASRPDMSVEAGLKYIQETPAVRDVILSGGDPLLLVDDALEDILSRLRGMTHVEIVRINTRVPVTLPERVTPRLCRILKRHHPLYVNTHFNHPSEITDQSKEACKRLAEAGIPLGNQTVLLKGVNDDLGVMKRLMQQLLILRIRPYYLHQMDPVQGTGHFRTPIERGFEIMAGLRGHTSGLANPYYVVDLPGGKGKVPILPDYVKRQGKMLLLRSYLGEVVEYIDPEA